MECYYHPGRESTDQCAICGKTICKECGLEIAGKTYCKECLEKIVGLGIENKAQQEPSHTIAQKPMTTEPATPDVNDEIYQPQESADEFEIPYTPQEEVQPVSQKGISADSPYNIRDNMEYEGGLDPEISYQKPQVEQQPQITPNELKKPNEEVIKQQMDSGDFIYPDHSYQPQETSARQELEDKYEKYLDDLYFDENEVPLNEQLAKDEAQYGSLTRRPYQPRPEEPVAQAPKQRKDPQQETPEEMEARIRAEILKEQNLMTGKEEKNIHNLNYQEEKEPMGVVDIILTIILVIVILIVLYYLIYLFFLSASYPTFMDAVYALTNPQNVINNILSK